MSHNAALTSPGWDTTTRKFGSAALNAGSGLATGVFPSNNVFTAECWAKAAGATTQIALGSYPWFWFGTEGTGKWVACAQNLTGVITSAITAADGAWHHLAYTSTGAGGTAYFFVDGVLIGTVATGTGTGQNAGTDSLGFMQFANSGVGAFPWAGEIDEVTIWGAAKYTANFTPPAVAYTGAETNLIGLWHLDSNGTNSTVGGTGSIVASPTSVTGGAAGVVVTITGTGTAFAGSPFSLTGGLGGVIVSQSVASATSATVTINPGLLGYGNLAITNSISGAAASLAVATPALGALRIGAIGDSMTYGTNGNPFAQTAAYLGALGYSVTPLNRAISGTTTNDWIAGSSNLTAAIAAFAASGVSWVQVMLGTNDYRPLPTPLSVAQHHANMASITGALVAAGFKVVLHKPPFTIPNSIPGVLQTINDPNGYYSQAFALDMQLVDGVNVFQGDTSAFAYSAQSPTVFLNADGLHPKDATQNNILGNFWGVAFAQKFGNAAGAPRQMHGAFFI